MFMCTLHFICRGVCNIVYGHRLGIGMNKDIQQYSLNHGCFRIRVALITYDHFYRILNYIKLSILSI